MKKYIACACLLLGSSLVADEIQPSQDGTETSIEQQSFTVTVAPEKGEVIRELVTYMAEHKAVVCAYYSTYLKDLGRQLRSLSSTQFLGYILERQDLVDSMKKIHSSPMKWKAITKSIVRGLKKENESSLSEDIPSFAKFTRSNKNVLGYMAKKENWDGFIVHLLEQN